MREFNFLIVGVGGQGALLASNVLALVGVQAGFDVKKAEVHGMSQRGGSVNSHIRWGSIVRSPVIGAGDVDILISLEKLETLRYLDLLKKGGLVFIGEFKIPPLTVSSGEEHYPDDKEIETAVFQVTPNLHWIQTLTLAEQAGTTKAHNVVLLGALSTKIPDVEQSVWLEVLESVVPLKFVDLNRLAFQLGRESQI